MRKETIGRDEIQAQYHFHLVQVRGLQWRLEAKGSDVGISIKASG